ncbi:MAG: hypothetical protein TREMPRED_004760 [Tremellales sp. Tagirdzhanova-0007]|nr:MAG: hypothetical protein TREMPRED_004760 [Tremellales sp. Tagirdzhanova-0007]
MAELNADGVVIKVQLDAVRNSAETTSVPPESSSVRDDNIVAESNEVSGLAAPAIVFPEIKYTSTNVTTTSGGRPYSSFSSGEKWFIVVLSAVAGTFSPISSNIYVPAIPTVADAFGVSSEDINLTVTVYLIFQALTPAIWGSAADSFGRRPIYLICLFIYVLSCIGLALCPTSAYWLLMLLRIFQATGGSAVIAIGTGVIADIAMPQERGRYLGIFNLCSTFGVSIGPLLGGVLAYTLGWRSIFWFLVISCTVAIVPMLFFFPETLRSLVGDGSIPPPLLNCTPAALRKRRREIKDYRTRGEDMQATRSYRSKFNPWASFQLALEPDVILIFLWSSLYYALWYALLAIFSTLLRDVYGSSEIIIGLCYLPNGIGAGISTVITGRVMDVIYRREKRRVGGDHRACPEQFRLERTRFLILPYQVGLLMATSISLGWSLEARAPIAVPIILNFFVGISASFLTTVTIYGVDLFTGQGGAVTATYNLARCLMGAASVSVIQIMNNAMGPGWSFVTLSGRRVKRMNAKEERTRRSERERINASARARDNAHVRLATHSSGHKAACKILPALHYPGSPQRHWDDVADAIEAHKEVVLLKALSGAGIEGIVGLEGVMVEGGWTYVFLTMYERSLSSYATPWHHDHLITFFRHLLHHVNHLHLLNISHEDLKRSNVLIDKKGNPVLVDFGFSHFSVDGQKVKSAGGTLDYTSPEKVMTGASYDPKANDVWALGIIFIKLLGLPHPFVSSAVDIKDDSIKFRERIANCLPHFDWQPEDWGAGGKAELVMGMLCRDPDMRWTASHPELDCQLPSMMFRSTISPPWSYTLILDLCFLAYLNDEFYLCESPRKMEDRLRSLSPCWEKRWAGMLGGWNKRAEMDWEDMLKVVNEPKKTVPLCDSRPYAHVESRVLREIHLSPNVSNESKLARPKVLLDSKRREGNTQIAPHRKSLIYGMKTKEASMRTVTPQESGPLIAKRFTQSQAIEPTPAGATAIVVADSSREAIPPGGFGRAKRPTFIPQHQMRKTPPDKLREVSNSLAPDKRPPRYTRAQARLLAPSANRSNQDRVAGDGTQNNDRRVSRTVPPIPA